MCSLRSGTGPCAEGGGQDIVIYGVLGSLVQWFGVVCLFGWCVVGYVLGFLRVLRPLSP